MATIQPIGPALPEPVHVTTFHAHFEQLRKTRYGDYSLALGVGKEDKDEAWKLSDYDGQMLEITIRVIPRPKSTWDTDG